MAGDAVEVEVDGHAVRVSSPDRVVFPERGITKWDLVQYYISVRDAVLRGVASRPTVMKRYPEGVDGDHFFQKRVPSSRPDWLRTVTVAFPSGRTAEELCPSDLAHVVWAVNLGCIDLNPWAVRRWDLEHPDELRVDLDPSPGVGFPEVREVAACVGEVLSEMGLVGFPKTSGSRGIHISVRLVTAWGFSEVREAALALAREVERRRGDLATSAWWKKDRGARVLIDYNQNARDRTVASEYSVRPTPRATVSMPFRWEDLPGIELEDFDVVTVPGMLAERGDLNETLDDHPCRLDALLELASRDREGGLGDAPWPPYFPRNRD